MEAHPPPFHLGGMAVLMMSCTERSVHVINRETKIDPIPYCRILDEFQEDTYVQHAHARGCFGGMTERKNAVL